MDPAVFSRARRSDSATDRRGHRRRAFLRFRDRLVPLHGLGAPSRAVCGNGMGRGDTSALDLCVVFTHEGTLDPCGATMLGITASVPAKTSPLRMSSTGRAEHRRASVSAPKLRRLLNDSNMVSSTAATFARFRAWLSNCSSGHRNLFDHAADTIPSETYLEGSLRDTSTRATSIVESGEQGMADYRCRTPGYDNAELVGIQTEAGGLVATQLHRHLLDQNTGCHSGSARTDPTHYEERAECREKLDRKERTTG